MDNEQLWKEYRALYGTNDAAHSIAVLRRCIDESTDYLLTYCAGRDLGMLYTNGPADVVDTEKAEEVLKGTAWIAAVNGYEHPDQYDEIGLQTLAQLQYQQGNLQAFATFGQALALGSVIAAQTLYRELNERPDGDNFSQVVKSNIRQQISDLYDECTDAMNEDGNPAAAKGVPQFALALVGLYGLGAEVGIDRAKGMEYLNTSVQLGNGHAKSVADHSELQDPRQFGALLQDPQRLAALLNGDGQAASAQAASAQEAQPQPQKAPQAKQAKQAKPKKKIPVWLIVLAVVLVVAWLARDVIAALVSSIVGALSGVLSVVFLLICLYIYSGGSDSSSSSSSSGDWVVPDTSYNFPSTLRDYNGNIWYLQSNGGDNATYYYGNEMRTFHASEFYDGMPSGFYN